MMNKTIMLTLPHVSAYSLYQRNKNLHFSYIFLVYRNMFIDYDVGKFLKFADVIVNKHVTVDEKDVRKVYIFVPLIKAVSRNVRKS